jgi:hypothetical protein
MVVVITLAYGNNYYREKFCCTGANIINLFMTVSYYIS